MLIFPIDVNCAIAFLALKLGLRALFLNMKLHITLEYAKPAPLLACLHGFVTLSQVSNRLLILVRFLTSAVFAFEGQSEHVRLHDSVHLSPFHRLVISALFRAAVIYIFPSVDAPLAEN